MKSALHLLTSAPTSRRSFLASAGAASLAAFAPEAFPAQDQTRDKETASPVSLPARLAGSPQAGLDNVFKDLAQRNLFSGAVLVRSGSHEAFGGAYGPESREYGSPNTISTRFNMASMGKMLTAALIGALVEAGQIHWQDTIDHFLGDNWIAQDAAVHITVAMLLSQTSGLGDYLDLILPLNPNGLRDLDTLKPYVRQAKLQAQPGTSFLYSNTGFELLGAIAEKVSGASYWDALEAHVLKPSAMTATSRFDPASVEKHVAQSYSMMPLKPSRTMRRPPARFDIAAMSQTMYDRSLQIEQGSNTISNTTSTLPASSAGGGAYTTAGDLARFFDAFNAGKLVSATTRAAMLAPQPLSDSYRLGFSLMDPAGSGYGHNGGAPGVSALGMFYADGGSLIVLSNVDRGAEVAYATLLNQARKTS